MGTIPKRRGDVDDKIIGIEVHKFGERIHTGW